MEIISDSKPVVSPWKGSEATSEMVREQLSQRYGPDLAAKFDARFDAMPFSAWLSQGFCVRRGEVALKSITFVEVRDENDKVVRKIRRSVNLFHRCQVEPIS
jgi:hypothetical protein